MELVLMSCPICQKPADPAFDPFCSRLCKNTDLLRWFKEEYRIPTEETLEEGGEIGEEDEK
jgi:endogenous inhibitor of DNA gyrase (YacG/DUF329 family)